MTDYGTDLYLDANRDVVFTADGDVRIQSGAALVAQDIREELYIYLGSVAWDADAGSDLILQLNSERDIGPTVCAELERVALKDDRIDAASVEAVEVSAGRYRLSFAVLGDVQASVLYFDLADLMGDDNG